MPTEQVCEGSADVDAVPGYAGHPGRRPGGYPILLRSERDRPDFWNFIYLQHVFPVRADPGSEEGSREAVERLRQVTCAHCAGAISSESSGYSQSASLLAHNRMLLRSLSGVACTTPDTSKSQPTAYCSAQLKQGTCLIRLNKTQVFLLTLKSIRTHLPQSSAE